MGFGERSRNATILSSQVQEGPSHRRRGIIPRLYLQSFDSFLLTSRLKQNVQERRAPPAIAAWPTAAPTQPETAQNNVTRWSPRKVLEQKSEQGWKAATDTAASEGLIEIRGFRATENQKTRVEYMPRTSSRFYL
jgi:hypothetical protein